MHGDKGGGRAAKPTRKQIGRARLAVAKQQAKQTFENPHASPQEKRAAAARAYHMAKRQHVLEENIAPPRGAERIVGQGVLDLADAAIHAPGGAYTAGRAVAHDTGRAAHGDLSFKHSRAIAKALAEATAHDLRHPLAHPGFTALDLLTLASAGAGTVARGTAAASAIRAGDIGAATRAVLHAPAPGTRTYRHGDLAVETSNSKNVLVRQAQKAHARGVNRTDNAARQSRVVGKHLLQEQRVVTATEPLRVEAEALAARGKSLSTPQELALRAVQEETPLETRIAALQREHTAAKPGSQRFIDTRQKILLHEAAKKYVATVNGKPVIKSEYRHLLRRRSPQRLAEVNQRVETTANLREQALIDAEVLTLESAAHRKSAPGRVDRGARYEKPTPAKMGVPSKGLERQRAIVAELEKRHESALTKAGRKAKPYPDVEVKVPGVKQDVTRAMTHEEATARLAELDKKYEQAVKKITPHVDPYQGESNVMDVQGRMRSVKQEEQRFRNMKSKKGGAGARYHEKGKSVSQEVRALAEDKLGELAAKHPDQQFSKDLAERERLHEALFGHMPGEQHGHLGTVTETVKTNGSVKHVPSDLPAKGTYTPPVTRFGGALSVARDRLIRMETAAAKRQKPVGIVGAEDFTGGRSRIPYTIEQGKKLGPAPAGYRGGEPRKPGSLTHDYTGALQRSGGYRANTSRLVAESAIEAQKYTNTLRLRERVLKASVKELPADEENYIAVRVKNVPMPPELRNLEHKIEEGVRLTAGEQQSLTDAFDNWKAQMFAEPRALRSFNGYRFVHRNLLGEVNQPRLLANVAHYRALRGVGHVVSETNNAVRAALLYLAPKYAVPNIGGNIFLNVSQQGYRAVPNFYRTLKIVDRDPALAARFRSAMGEGFARQLQPTRGVTRHVSEPLAQGWSKIVDEKFRESALLDELRKLGYTSRDQLLAAFDNPANQGHLVEAVQRARESIGDYDRLGAVEKDIVRHAIFFYTWAKVSARLSKMMLVDRPIQSQAIVQAGRLGEQQQRKDLGGLPSYMEPLFQVGGSHGHPLVSNASALNVFTAADLAKSGINLLRGEHNQSGYQVADNLSPFFGLAVAAITGRDPFTQQQVHGDLAHLALGQLTGGLPQTALANRLHRSHTDQSAKAYTYTPGQAVGQFFLGPLGEHGLNPAPTHELAAKEHLADVPPVMRSRLSVFRRRQSFYTEAKRLGMLKHGQLPQELRDAFGYEAQRQALYTEEIKRAGAKPGTAQYHLAKFKANIRFLRQHGGITASEARQWAKQADGNASDKGALEKANDWISRHYFQTGFLNTINAGKKQLEHAGAHGLG